MRCAARAWAAALAALLAAAPVAATTVIQKDLAALCAEADVVFVGDVAAVQSQWADPQRQAIETTVAFANVVPLLGAAAGAVVLGFGGGQIGDVREEVAGVPRFAPGERVVIFARQERAISPIVGFNQGCFRVVSDPRGPVVLSAERLPLVGVAGGIPVFGSAEEGTRRAMGLDAFLDAVRRQLADRRDPGP